MEGHCSTAQSPQWAVVSMEEEEKKKKKKRRRKLLNVKCVFNKDRPT